MTILLSTIVRNEARFLDRWYAQIREMTSRFAREHVFCLSVFENDSTDGSGAKLAAMDWSFLPAYQVTHAKLNSSYYIGGKSATRTALLADARNRAIFQFPFLSEVDSVLVIESDVTYSMDTVDKLLNHERHYGKKLDIFTGKSVHPNSGGHLYDSWGSRRLAAHSDWCDGDGKEDNGFEEMWTTFNCLCLYRRDALQQVGGFGGVNPRTGQPDCDPVVVCERFRAAGFNQIYWDTRLHVEHDCS